MYIILVYDIGVERVAKALKLCRQYLHWIQNSVFEGEISELKLRELLDKLKSILKEEEDSVIVFILRQEKWVEKRIIGLSKGSTDMIL